MSSKNLAGETQTKADTLHTTAGGAITAVETLKAALAVLVRNVGASVRFVNQDSLRLRSEVEVDAPLWSVALDGVAG